jgi:hypothetical protein
MTGTMVVEESLPVVVSQKFVVTDESVKSEIVRPGGSVVIVDVMVPLGTVVTGPTVKVDPSVVMVVRSVIISEPEGIVSVT